MSKPSIFNKQEQLRKQGNVDSSQKSSASSSAPSKSYSTSKPPSSGGGSKSRSRSKSSSSRTSEHKPSIFNKQEQLRKQGNVDSSQKSSASSSAPSKSYSTSKPPSSSSGVSQGKINNSTNQNNPNFIERIKTYKESGTGDLSIISPIFKVHKDPRIQKLREYHHTHEKPVEMTVSETQQHLYDLQTGEGGAQDTLQLAYDFKTGYQKGGDKYKMLMDFDPDAPITIDGVTYAGKDITYTIENFQSQFYHGKKSSDHGTTKTLTAEQYDTYLENMAKSYAKEAENIDLDKYSDSVTGLQKMRNWVSGFDKDTKITRYKMSTGGYRYEYDFPYAGAHDAERYKKIINENPLGASILGWGWNALGNIDIVVNDYMENMKGKGLGEAIISSAFGLSVPMFTFKRSEKSMQTQIEGLYRYDIAKQKLDQGNIGGFTTDFAVGWVSSPATKIGFAWAGGNIIGQYGSGFLASSSAPAITSKVFLTGVGATMAFHAGKDVAETAQQGDTGKAVGKAWLLGTSTLAGVHGYQTGVQNYQPIIKYDTSASQYTHTSGQTISKTITMDRYTTIFGRRIPLSSKSVTHLGDRISPVNPNIINPNQTGTGKIFTMSSRDFNVVPAQGYKNTWLFASKKQNFFQTNPDGKALVLSSQTSGVSRNFGKLSVSQGTMLISKNWKGFIGTAYENTQLVDITSYTLPAVRITGSGSYLPSYNFAKFSNRSTGDVIYAHGAEIFGSTNKTVQRPIFANKPVISSVTGEEFTYTPKAFTEFMVQKGIANKGMGYFKPWAKLKGGAQGEYYPIERSIQVDRFTPWTKTGAKIRSIAETYKRYGTLKGEKRVSYVTRRNVLAHENEHFIQDIHGYDSIRYRNISDDDYFKEVDFLEDWAHGDTGRIKSFVIEGVDDYGYITDEGGGIFLKHMFRGKELVDWKEYEALSVGRFSQDGKIIGEGLDYSRFYYRDVSTSTDGAGLQQQMTMGGGGFLGFANPKLFSGTGIIGAGKTVGSSANIPMVGKQTAVSTKLFPPFQVALPSYRYYTPLLVPPISEQIQDKAFGYKTIQTPKFETIQSPFQTTLQIPTIISKTDFDTTQIPTIITDTVPSQVQKKGLLQTPSFWFKTKQIPTIQPPFNLSVPPPLIWKNPFLPFGSGGGAGGNLFRMPSWWGVGYRSRTWKVASMKDLLPDYDKIMKKIKKGW